MSRIEERFAALGRAGDGGLVVFTVAGHPTLEDSTRALEAIADAGADVIEIGVPFSDPLADGPVIQAASQRALQNEVTPTVVFDLADNFRRTHQTPLVLMTCYNPIYQYGVARFAEDCAGVGADGVIVTDLPPEEAQEWVEAARANAVDTVFLLAPTSSLARMKAVANLATGFVYCISRLGVTGARHELPTDLRDLVSRIRAQTPKPIAVGFGISRPEHVAQVCGVADGAIVGSALVSLLDQTDGAELPQTVGRFVEELKAATKGIKKDAG
jgi:tryptophan synthase alpha chain